MTETKVTATLPTVTIEISRAEAPEGQPERVTIRMTAAPSFDAFARAMVWPGLPANPAALTNPLLMWGEMVQAAWRPWLALAGAAGFLPRRK